MGFSRFTYLSQACSVVVGTFSFIVFHFYLTKKVMFNHVRPHVHSNEAFACPQLCAQNRCKPLCLLANLLLASLLLLPGGKKNPAGVTGTEADFLQQLLLCGVFESSPHADANFSQLNIIQLGGYFTQSVSFENQAPVSSFSEDGSCGRL